MIGLFVSDIGVKGSASCLYGVDPKEKDIEASVEGEPDQVEGEKVKVEANHADVEMFYFFEHSMEIISLIKYLSKTNHLFRLKFSKIWGQKETDQATK